MATMREKLLADQEALRKQGIAQAKRVAKVAREAPAATRRAVEAGVRGLERQSQEALAASVTGAPVSGARIAAIQQAGRKRGEAVAGARAKGESAIQSQILEGEKTQLEAIKFQAEATPDDIEELARINAEIDTFAQSAGVIGEQKKVADYARRLAQTTKSPYAKTQVMSRATSIDKGIEDV